MDWGFAIERHREALKRVLAALIAMAGLGAMGSPLAPCDGKREGEAGNVEGSPRPTLPRHLHRAVLRLLRPAESAARRLVIAAARGLVETLPRSRPRRPTGPTAPRPGTGIWMPPHLRPRPSRASARAKTCALPLFDPLPRWGASKRPRARGVPRLCVPGLSELLPVPPERTSKASPDDAIDAARLALRLAALGRALDDLPRQAKRFARWRMRLAQAEGARERQASGPARARRLSPLKPGRLPSVGRRAGALRRPGHGIFDILKDAHSLAVRAMELPDSS